MRVALVSEHASPLAVVGAVDAGGQNVHVAALAAGLSAQGHQVTVYTRRDDPGLPEETRTAAGYTVTHVDAGPPVPLAKDALWAHMPAFADHLAALLAADRPDVLHAHFWMSAWAATQVAQRDGDDGRLPVLVTFHALGAVKRRHQGGADTSPPERVAVELAVATAADRVIATCSDEVTELSRLGVPAGRTTVVPCGVDAQRFSPEVAPLPRTGAGHRLVTVGRLVPRKGFAVVIEALVRLPGTELVVAGGTAEDADERARLVALATRLGVADRVHLVGQVPRADMPGLLRSADVVVCAPWYEPFGLVPLEAMACGVPVVASATGGMLDTVQDGVTGALVPPRDPGALADAVAALLADPDRRARYGAAGRQRVLRSFTWPQVAQATAGVYASVARAGVGRGAA